MTAQIYNFKPHKSGDTKNAVIFTVKTRSSPEAVAVAVDLTGASIKMDARNSVAKVKRWTSGDGLTITDAANGKFKFDEQVISLDPFTYDYDIELTLSDGRVKTWIAGKMPITRDVTRG